MIAFSVAAFMLILYNTYNNFVYTTLPKKRKNNER